MQPLHSLYPPCSQGVAQSRGGGVRGNQGFPQGETSVSETFEQFGKMSVPRFRRWYLRKRADCDARGRSLLNTLHAPYLAQRHGWLALWQHFKEMDAR